MKQGYRMTRILIHQRVWPLMVVLLCWMTGVSQFVCAQHMDSLQTSLPYRVTGFRALPNDVSAFISPVRDLNGEACALLKVVAPKEFAFSSPLGIVKRKDAVGEIWLYLPTGTRSITLKHPQWGVLRDYRFGRALESRITYELTVEIPQPELETSHDTVVVTKTVVDTLAITIERPRLPLRAYALVTATPIRDVMSWGVMLAAMRRHGAFLHARSNFGSTGHSMQCDADGAIEGRTELPYYSGEVRHADVLVTAGAIHRLTSWLNIFEGMGYGKTATAWQLGASEGGDYVLNSHLTHEGMSGEAGLLGSWKWGTVMASVSTIAGQRWMGCIGIGLKLGK